MNLPVRHLCIRPPRPASHGFTLIEISLVIALMLGLMALGGMSVSAVQDWNKGKNAAVSLRAAYTAQRSYLADFPTADISTVTAAALVPYLPTGWSAMPTAVGLKSETLTLDHTVMPPVFRRGTTTYDPSASQQDELWDVGKQ